MRFLTLGSNMVVKTWSESSMPTLPPPSRLVRLVLGWEKGRKKWMPPNFPGLQRLQTAEGKENYKIFLYCGHLTTLLLIYWITLLGLQLLTLSLPLDLPSVSPTPRMRYMFSSAWRRILASEAYPYQQEWTQVLICSYGVPACSSSSYLDCLPVHFSL